MPEAEGVADVLPSSLQIESELGQGRTRPAKTPEQRQVQSSAQGSSQEERLVESPFSQAPGMGGDRHQEGWGEGFGPLAVGFLQQARQRMRQPAVAGELEAMDQLPQGSGVRSPSPGRVMEGSHPPAGRTGFRSPRIRPPIRKRRIHGGCGPAAFRAERVPEPGQLQEALRTKGTGVGIGDPAAAKHAALGKEEDLEPLPDARPQSDPRNGRHTYRNARPGETAKRIRNSRGARQESRPDSLSS